MVGLPTDWRVGLASRRRLLTSVAPDGTSPTRIVDATRPGRRLLTWRPATRPPSGPPAGSVTLVRDLISPESLAELLPEATVLDVRWQLGRSDGHEQYLSGHVPGAAYVDLATELSDPPGGPVDVRGRHPLPDPGRFGEAMRRCGVTASRPVVVYDDTSGLAAARAWWLLRHHGHDDVRLLDGGWSAWVASGGAVEQGEPAIVEGDFAPGPGRLPVLDADGAAAAARSGVLLDARSPERFRGETEPVGPGRRSRPGRTQRPDLGQPRGRARGKVPAGGPAARGVRRGAARRRERRRRRGLVRVRGHRCSRRLRAARVGRRGRVVRRLVERLDL